MSAENSKADLSVCMIVRNEENVLVSCIESIIDCAAEIIVVDTGSTDSTKSIAEKYGCRIFDIPWDNDFSKARNFALSKAEHKYILSIDADERLLNPELIKSTLEQSRPDTAGWLIEVKSEAVRPDGGVDTYVSKLLRLFNNHPDIRFYGIIHEQVIDSIIKLGYKIEDTELKFLHLGYNYSSEQMQSKQLRNLELLTTALTKNPNDGYALFQRGKTYLALKDLIKAEEDIKKSLVHLSPVGAVRPQALNIGGIISYQLGDYKNAIIRAQESLKTIPNQAFANFILGESFSAMLEYNAALEAYDSMQAALHTTDVYSQIAGDYYLPSEQVSFRMGRCFVGLKKFDEAKEVFTEGNKYNPRDISCIVGLANVAFQNKNWDECQSYLSDAISYEPENMSLKQYMEQVKDAIIHNNDTQTETKTNKSQEEMKDRITKAENGKPFLSLSMIVKNEEVFLEGCLESVKDIVDEIVIVDTGSTDRTKEIAGKFGAKIFDFEWIDDFAAARNEAMTHCSGEWILYLDADERLTEESIGKVIPLLKKAGENMGAFICTIESNHVQLDGSKELHRGGYPRIFRNYGYPTIQFKGRVHEQITPTIFELGKGIDFCEVVVEHLGYNQSREVMEGKVKRNYTMLMAHIQEDPLNGYAWYQLGQTLAQMQLFVQAEEAIRFGLNAGNMSDSVYSSATSTLAQLVGMQKKYEEALYWAEQSLEKAPTQVYALDIKAYCLMYLDRLDESESTFHEVLRRLQTKQGVPQTGFDIQIPEQVIYNGLEEIRKRREGKNSTYH